MSCPICQGKRRSYCLICRFEEYLEVLKRYSRSEQETLEHYRQSIMRGIEAAVRYDKLDSLEILGQVKEAYGIELTLKWRTELLRERPRDKTVFNRARKCAFRRKPSWYVQLIRQKESIQILPKPHLLEYDEDGSIVDSGLVISGWTPYSLNPPDPFRSNPEEFLFGLEVYRKIENLSSVIGSLDKERASEYQRILEMQLNGIDVFPEHGPRLRIESSKVTGFKIQMIENARELIAQDDSTIAEAQALYKAQKGKKWKVKKSTFKQRKALYRHPRADEIKPRLVRLWKVIDGGKCSARGTKGPQVWKGASPIRESASFPPKKNKI